MNAEQNPASDAPDPNGPIEAPATESDSKKTNGPDRQRTSFGRLTRLATKELLEILRDRRTIITLVLMPLLVYPLLGMVVQKFMLNSLNEVAEVNYIIGLESEYEIENLQRLLGVGHQILERQKAKQIAEANETGKNNDEKDAAEGDPDSKKKELNQNAIQDLLKSKLEKEPKINVVNVESMDGTLESLLADGVIDLGVRFKDVEKTNSRNGRVVYETQKIELVSRESSENGGGIYEFVTERIEAVNDVWLKQSARIGLPYQFAGKTVAAASQDSKPSLLTFVPLMLVLMTMTGAVYPAIDLTAGERERGTMEILIAAPVSRMALLFGKFIAVLAVAMLTALINMLSMTITIYTLGLDSIIFGSDGISPTVLLTIFGLLLVFAAFFSAVLLGLTSFARSFKEAQAYLIPIMLVSLAPGLVSLIPDFKMEIHLALVPLLNIVLAARDVISGQFDLVLIAITVISTIIYGLVALGLAARVFGTDSVLFGGSSSWSDLFHKTENKLDVPTMPTAMLFLAVLFPSFIVLGGLSQRFGEGVNQKLMINAIVTVVLFVGLPLLFSRLFHSRFKPSFQFYSPRATAVIAALLLGSAVWMVAFEIEVLSLTGGRLEVLKEIFEQIKYDLMAIPLWLKLVCLALAPAVCEEFTFRGYLFGAFRKHCSAVITIVATAVLFGLFHVFVRDALMFERMIPSTMMGLLLGFVCYRTRSVIPGMILHTIHNGLLITMSHYENQLQDWGIGITEQKHLPATWLMIGAVPILVGLAMVTMSLSRSRAPDTRSSEAT